MTTPHFCVKCGFRLPIEDAFRTPHYCPRPSSVKVYNEEEKRAFEKKRLAEEAEKKGRRSFKTKPGCVYTWKPRSKA